MMKKIIGIILCMLMISTACGSVFGYSTNNENEKLNNIDYKNLNLDEIYYGTDQDNEESNNNEESDIESTEILDSDNSYNTNVGTNSYYGIISEDAYNPRVSRGENNQYYSVVLVDDGDHPEQYVEIYKNTGNPATDPWEYVNDMWSSSYAFLSADIEVVSSDDRIYVVGGSAGQLTVAWYSMSNPETYDFAGWAIEHNGNPEVSITSDEVDYKGNSVKLYCSFLLSSYKVGIVKINRDLTEGGSWYYDDYCPPGAPLYLPEGNAIAYCPQNDAILVLYGGRGDTFVLQGLNRGSGTWDKKSYVIDDMFYDRFASGIACMYGGHVLVTGYGAIGDGLDKDIIFTYSSTGGNTWWNERYFEQGGEQTHPSCAANDNGYFSILHYDSQNGMRTKRIIYSDLPAGAWSVSTIDSTHYYDGLSSACMQDGTDPKCGGAYASGGHSQHTSYFGWNGNPPPANLEWNPTSHDFGSIFVEQQSSTYDFVLTNTGGTATSGTVSTTGDFHISGSASYSLDPSNSKTFQVYFKPTITGQRTGTLKASSANNPVASLSGTGVLDNQPPNAPSTPSGPSSGDTGISYEYSTSTIDPDGDQIKYGWDWNGNGNVDEWTSLYSSGSTCSKSHSWSSEGTYNVKVKAEDSNGAQSSWSSAKTVTISGGSEEVYLEEAITCGWSNVETGEHGPLKTDFDLGEEVHFYLDWASENHDFYGDTVAYEWFHNDESWYYDYLITEHWTSVYWINNWAPPTSGTGYIKAFWNGQYLGKTNDYTVLGSILEYSTDNIDFGNKVQGQGDTKTFEIWNGGTGSLSYSISENINWITVSPTSGSSTGEHDTITLTITNTESLIPNTYEGDIQITSDSGSGTIHVILTIVEPSPKVNVEDSISISANPGEHITRTFYIYNSGYEGSELDWKIVIDWPDWGNGWTCSPLQGDDLQTSGKHQVTLEFDAPDNKDTFSGSIRVENRDDSSDYDILSLSCSTSKSKTVNSRSLDNIVQKFSEYFPFFGRVLELLNNIINKKLTLFNN